MNLEDDIYLSGMRYLGNTYSERKWKAMFEFTIEQIAYLMEILDDTIDNILNFLFYIKNYPTYDVVSCLSGLDTKTFRKNINHTVQKLYEALPFLNIDHRFDDWDYKLPSCTADGFDCPIENPQRFLDNQAFHSNKGFIALRYVVVTHVTNGEFLWVSNAYKGATSEITICRQELFPLLPNNEKILADRLFRYSDRFITALAYNCEYTRAVNSMRNLVERRIGVIKHFRIFTTPFRSPNYDFHCVLVKIVCMLINYLE